MRRGSRRLATRRLQAEPRTTLAGWPSPIVRRRNRSVFRSSNACSPATVATHNRRLLALTLPPRSIALTHLDFLPVLLKSPVIKFDKESVVMKQSPLDFVHESLHNIMTAIMQPTTAA